MTSLISLSAILRRELEALSREVAAYPDEALLWAPVPGMPNTGGTLVRHLCGNLQHYLGAILGGTTYQRDRDAEFLGAPWARSRLLTEISATIAAVTDTLARLPEERLGAEYPIAVADQRLVTGDFLLHLAVHCGFHLGQVDYHRRSATAVATSIAPMAIASLATARSSPHES